VRLRPLGLAALASAELLLVLWSCARLTKSIRDQRRALFDIHQQQSAALEALGR
jgi:hypothetical protein